MKQHIKIGTRGSQLALYQAEFVKDLILKQFPMLDISTVVIKTSGDMIRRGSFDPFQTKRIFTREIEDALLQNEVDLAVHSAKDMAVDLPEGLEISSVTEREDARDCLISKEKAQISELPLGARIGTSSIRRKLQLLRWNSELNIEDVRGNVDTRIRKIEEGLYDAIVLAHAGVKRLGLGHTVSEIFPAETFYPSPCQGIIALESRKGDPELKEILQTLNHRESFIQLECERAFLKRLEGGCQLPCGITTRIQDGKIKLAGALFAIEERAWVEGIWEASVDHPKEAGIQLAEIILNQGGAEILQKIREAKK
ncbi:MAG: hydroxymethylbilane synthase [Candidatus Omnitrophica bacterium]|nr:hydroxymethylbilane synthase [Candidatus Omnitrophota bacterium]